MMLNFMFAHNDRGYGYLVLPKAIREHSLSHSDMVNAVAKPAKCTSASQWA